MGVQSLSFTRLLMFSTLQRVFFLPFSFLFHEWKIEVLWVLSSCSPSSLLHRQTLGERRRKWYINQCNFWYFGVHKKNQKIDDINSDMNLFSLVAAGLNSFDVRGWDQRESHFGQSIRALCCASCDVTHQHHHCMNSQAIHYSGTCVNLCLLCCTLPTPMCIKSEH